MSCSTDTYDCAWEPSGIYAVVGIRGTPKLDQLPIVELEVCRRCRLLRLPPEDEQNRDHLSFNISTS